jgi:hypothetical protein
MLKLLHKLILRIWDRFGVVRSAFAPCMVSDSLLEAVTDTAKNATSGDVGLARTGWFELETVSNHQYHSAVHCRETKSIGWGVSNGNPNINGKAVTTPLCSEVHDLRILLRGFLRQTPMRSER